MARPIVMPPSVTSSKRPSSKVRVSSGWSKRFRITSIIAPPSRLFKRREFLGSFRSLLQSRPFIRIAFVQLPGHPCPSVLRGGWIYAEIPDKQINLFFVEQFHHSILAGRQRFRWSQLDPVAQRGGRHGNPAFLLADLAVHCNI